MKLDWWCLLRLECERHADDYYSCCRVKTHKPSLERSCQAYWSVSDRRRRPLRDSLQTQRAETFLWPLTSGSERVYLIWAGDITSLSRLWLRPHCRKLLLTLLISARPRGIIWYRKDSDDVHAVRADLWINVIFWHMFFSGILDCECLLFLFLFLLLLLLTSPLWTGVRWTL